MDSRRTGAAIAVAATILVIVLVGGATADPVSGNLQPGSSSSADETRRPRHRASRGRRHLGACGKDAITELVVVVDSNLSVPMELDEVRIDLVGPAVSPSVRRCARERRRAASHARARAPRRPLDRQDHRDGAPRGSDLVQRRATTAFISGETRVLRLHLLRECLAVRCASTETCASGGCRGIDVAPSELEAWTGTVERFDASVPDAQVDGGDVDACVAGPRSATASTTTATA